MYLINSVLQKPTAIYSVASGSFSSADCVEFAIVRGSSYIELLIVQNGPLGTTLALKASCDTFSMIRAVEKIRPSGEPVDLLAILSDSGIFVIARVSSDGLLERIFTHAYGKSGCRRTSPCHFMSVDPQGRAVVLCAFENSRIIYVIEREGTEAENAGTLKFRSPLEANRPNFYTLAVRFLHHPANPRYAILERDFAGNTHVSVFEVELGLNHVVKVATIEVEPSTYEIIPLQNGDFVLYMEKGSTVYRVDGSKRIIIVRSQVESSLISCHSTSGLVQYETGELVDITTNTSLGTIAVAAHISECNGFVFSASIAGSHGFHHVIDGQISTIDTLPNMSPLACGHFGKPLSAKREDSLRLYAGFVGHGFSKFDVLCNNLPVNIIASSPLPEQPSSVFKVSKDLYAICFSTSTMFLRAGDSLEEDLYTPFDSNSTYILFSELANAAGILAVTSHGWRQVCDNAIIEFEGGIICACANSRQLAIMSSDCQLTYFELSSTGQMRQVISVKMPSPAATMAFSPIRPGRNRSKFLLVGGEDSIVRLLSCDPSDIMSQISLQAAAKPPSSVAFTMLNKCLYAHIGLRNGVYVRLAVDESNGSLTNPQSRYLGAAPIVFYDVQPCGELVAVCSKSYIIYADNSCMSIAPLSNDQHYSYASFSTPSIPNTMLSIGPDRFSILAVSNFEIPFSGQQSVSPSLPIKRVYFIEQLSLILTLETDSKDSCLHIFSDTNTLISSLDIDGKACTSAIITKFENRSDDWFLLVGATDISGRHEIMTYSYNPENHSLSLIHSNEYPDRPNVIVPFAGKVIIGCDFGVRLFDMGKKRLLKKCEVSTPSAVHFLDSQGLRVYAGTAMSSVIFIIYRPAQNLLQCFADDIANRPLSAMCVIDYETVCIADRLGAISVLRLPNGITESMEKDPTGLTTASRETFFATPHKLERVCEYSLGDTITVLSKGTLFLGARQSLLYATISGSIGMFTPIQYRALANTLQTIERDLRYLVNQDDSYPLCSITGRHQLLRRSACGHSVKGVVDGQFCLVAFSSLTRNDQSRIAESVDKPVEEILDMIKSAMQII